MANPKAEQDEYEMDVVGNPRINSAAHEVFSTSTIRKNYLTVKAKNGDVRRTTKVGSAEIHPTRKGVQLLGHDPFLSYEELLEIAAVVAEQIQEDEAKESA